MASCQKGQRGLDLPDKGHGLFAWCLAEGYGGAADANRDTLVEPTELFAYLQKVMPAAGAQDAQTPELFLPDDRPPRLSEAAKTSIRKLARYVDIADQPGSAWTRLPESTTLPCRLPAPSPNRA